MTRQTIRSSYPVTIDWLNEDIIDWASAGKLYCMDGSTRQIGRYHFAFSFDGAITSDDGVYAFIYKRLGTKGLLLKHGEIIREINRPYYHAEVYEYPATFMSYNNKTYLVHCPVDYCRLDFEEVETGVIVTDVRDRKPVDVFHSRLSVSPDDKYLMVCGWAWHPVDTVELFNIGKCFENPHLLDKADLSPDFGTQINSSSFIDHSRILIHSSKEEPFQENPILPPGHIAIWNFVTDELSGAVPIDTELGNIFAIDQKRAWDMYKFPKIVNIETGKIECSIKEINSGIQNSSIIGDNIDTAPQIRFNKRNGKILIMADKETIEVLSP